MSEQLGSAMEEAARLLAALEEWARSRVGVVMDDEHLATGSPTCLVCPLCQAVSALRAVRPETVEHLLDAAASVVAALRTTVGGETAPSPAASRVQHIDVREV